MMSSQNIEDVIRHARVTTSAAADARVADAVEAAIEKHNQQHPAFVRTGGAIRRIIMKSKWTKLATAAAIIIATLLGMYALTGSVDVASISMAQIRHAMENIDWMRMVDKTDGNAGPQGAWYSFASRLEIVCDPEGRIIYDDFNIGKKYVWNPGSDYIYESSIDQTRQFAGDIGQPFDLFAHLFDTMTSDKGWSTTKESGTYQGRNVEIWTAQHMTEKNGTALTETTVVYIDVETKLPVGIKEYEEIEGNIQLDNDVEITYPETGPADIYEAGAPGTAQIKPS